MPIEEKRKTKKDRIILVVLSDPMNSLKSYT
ncbi:hypothetical protein SAMN05444001_11027 [Parabacteroides chinchillae]|uniref:Uncharacterized protein n=1 Tax=Parabacteroides chinchillae TaxID=871327 RepID=A0A8G2FB15_9BACT|nr:hypothetical protein SAMN05444001_11027 [Parabacteroides chinchillae]